jgi:hypothetical protein
VIDPALRTRLLALLALLAALTTESLARAEENEPPARQMTQQEIESWLDARAVTGTRDVAKVEEQPEAPPPPPRRHGFVVESSVGAFGHLGTMKNISPTSPWFHLHFGYEPFQWLMAFLESDVVFSSTSYASPPPEPRSYALYGFGGGARVTIKPADRFGVYVQGSLGVARVSDDVLSIYGYRDAADFNSYFGGVLGLEWYQVSPHYALSLFGGARDYPKLFARSLGGETPLAWLGGASLRYSF